MSTRMRFGAGGGAAAGATTPASIGAFDLFMGEALVAGQDLDYFLTPGCWYCSTSTVAAAVAHSPTTASGYKLIVMEARASRYIQLAIRNAASCIVHIRHYNGSSWDAWKTITPA